MAVALKVRPERFDVAVFPLLEKVLFPGTSLPLHIHEERYARMLEEVQAKKWPLAVALVTPHDGNNFFLNTICGAGTVEITHNYGDGRSDILVHADRRVKLHGFIQKEPWFIMEAEELGPRASRDDLFGKGQFEELQELIKTWIFLGSEIQACEAPVFDRFQSAGEMVDFFVFHYMKRALDKQIYLNCTDPVQRGLMLSEYLKTDLVRLGRRHAKTRSARLIH